MSNMLPSFTFSYKPYSCWANIIVFGYSRIRLSLFYLYQYFSNFIISELSRIIILPGNVAQRASTLAVPVFGIILSSTIKQVLPLKATSNIAGVQNTTSIWGKRPIVVKPGYAVSKFHLTEKPATSVPIDFVVNGGEQVRSDSFRLGPEDLPEFFRAILSRHGTSCRQYSAVTS